MTANGQRSGRLPCGCHHNAILGGRSPEHPHREQRGQTDAGTRLHLSITSAVATPHIRSMLHGLVNDAEGEAREQVYIAWADFLQRIGYPYDFTYRDDDGAPILPPRQVLQELAVLWWERDGGGSSDPSLEDYALQVYEEAGVPAQDR